MFFGIATKVTKGFNFQARLLRFFQWAFLEYKKPHLHLISQTKQPK
jgi:hypothetical protein